MITKFHCPICSNNDPQKAIAYNGLLGYECIYCACCATKFDHNGMHLPDETEKKEFELYPRPDKTPQKPSSSWIETHHEIVSAIILSLHNDEETHFKQVNETQGTGGIWELAEDLTDEFLNLHKDREWDGEFFDEIEQFINQKSKPE
jgi:hypothetical protein